MNDWIPWAMARDALGDNYRGKDGRQWAESRKIQYMQDQRGRVFVPRDAQLPPSTVARESADKRALELTITIRFHNDLLAAINELIEKFK